MTYRRRGRGGRPAFTLIELLVVIAIIAILMSLTTAAALRVLAKGPELQTRSEIGEFESDILLEQRDFKTPIFPSKLALREDNAYSSSNPLHVQTYTCLRQMFGRHLNLNIDNRNPAASPPPVGSAPFTDWNGNGTQDSGDLILEGEQCLVFYLGGIPSGPTAPFAMQGFSTDVTNPALAGGTTRRGPFFQFQSARLKMFTTPGSGGQFPIYIDPWKAGTGPWGPGQPYAYFASSVVSGNGSYQAADCLSLGVSPYVQQSSPTVVFVNPSSFQIISAGRNGAFGPGGLWNPATGLGPFIAGSDDQANFSKKLLGAPAN
jgi:prepilin-type N-terminal cleavage/methylation domain-containing protein